MNMTSDAIYLIELARPLIVLLTILTITFSLLYLHSFAATFTGIYLYGKIVA